MTNSHNRTSAVATASSGRNPGDRYAHGTNLNASSSNHQNHNNHQHNNNNSQHQTQHSNHSNSITALFGNSDGNNNHGSNKKNYFGGSSVNGGGGGYFSNRKGNQFRNNPGSWQRTPVLNASRCVGGNNLLSSSAGRVELRTTGSGSGSRYHGKTAGNHQAHNLSSFNGRTNGIQVLMNGFNRRGTSPPTLLPTSLTHFASSKCFDAPAPTALPKPPQHWTTTSSQNGSANNCNRNNLFSGRVNREKSAKRSLIDEFDTHNLKMLLNVQS